MMYCKNAMTKVASFTYQIPSSCMLVHSASPLNRFSHISFYATIASLNYRLFIGCASVVVYLYSPAFMSRGI